METTTTATATNPFNTLLGLLFIALIVFLIYCKKKKKSPIQTILNLIMRKKTGANNAKRNADVYTVDGVPTVSSPKKRASGGRSSVGKDHSHYSKLISIAKFQKVAFGEYVVFDLETTGLDSDHDMIVEIGAVKVRNGRIVDRYQQLINPGIHIPEDASSVNSITDDLVKKAPTISKALPGFLSFVDGNVLAAHNGGFDASFLDNACRQCGLEAPEAYFDTMRLSVYWPNLPNRKLSTFLDAAGIKNSEAHRALSDAESLAKLIIASMKKL